MGQWIARADLQPPMPGSVSPSARQRGFTLIELMVCVGILAVLAALTYPRYSQHLATARVTEARAALGDIASQLERCYSRYLRYDAPQCEPGTTDVERGSYRLQRDIKAGHYRLTATAIADGTVPAGCTLLSLDQAGLRVPDECW
ncbi:type IV pilin protein [Halomonas huangheensis]|nr:type IV pilin protein [Halomonas huangheensis]